MAIDPQDDIVQDFLVESREILEGLGEQLVSLEQAPEDRDLLNSVFRGFHTIKGGAGFLGLDELVDVCHQTEDIFNLLRQGEKQMSPELMDDVLQALDVVNGMFDRIEDAQDLEPAPGGLLQALRSHNQPDDNAGGAATSASDGASAGEGTGGTTAAPSGAAAPGGQEAASGDISDQEFEALLDALDGEGVGDGGSAAAKDTAVEGAGAGASAGAGAAAGDEITDDEFERLLDDLHGEGSHHGVPSAPANAADGQGPGDAADGDEITDDEFEKVLDQLHGSGQGPTGGQTDAAETPVASGGGSSAAREPSSRRPEASAGGGHQGGGDGGAAAGGGQHGAGGHGHRGETSVRVDTAKLDDIMNLVGELVLVRNRLANLRGEIGDERLSHAVGNLEHVTSDLQNSVMKTRMQPIRKVFGRFPRVIRDLARNLEKEVELVTAGEETDLDKNLVEALADPLVHLIRNSVDHGLEPPDERQSAGKRRTGTVRLAAEQEGDHILLTIADDGRGMDPDKLREIAVKKGVLDAESARRLDDSECYNLIFAPGFSTKEQISDVSGRGVGMDVVKNSISQLNGTIDIDSELGRGTIIRIKVPLTLAILPTLMVRIAGRKFALPMSVVREIFELERGRTNVVDGRLTVMVRHKAMPLFFLERWLDRMGAEAVVPAKSLTGEDQEKDSQVVTVVIGHQTVGFVVDEVIGLEEVVIKPLGAILHGLPGLAGSTITGDGSIALIVDIPSLIKQYGSRL
ncbi:chemotaxis protein CheA [Arhodomonas sp. KWT2]|uniref:chemotaxis protein CheA n=1 Tax=Arhodomonas sp. KWT2 TaxID=3344194 RepID=UPI0035C01182